jgi:ABC-type branched-subunit amino acid transport system substrate-binding protein
MAKNYAIVIGINKYERLSHLKYAKRDAEKMRDFFNDIANFDRVDFFSDDSPDIILRNGRSTTSSLPSLGNLHSYLEEWFDKSFLKLAEGDNFWFFFAGHGFEIDNKDYLVPIDGNTSARTGIEVNYIRERLINCGSANVILIIDACRSGGDNPSTGARGNESGIGNQEQQGVFTIYACSRKKTSYEIDELEHGVFTYALLEGLKSCEGNRSLTAKELEEYLKSRVPQLCSEYKKPNQLPCIGTPESASQSNVILLPQIPEYYQKITEITAKKQRAYWLANNEGKLKEALKIAREADVLANGGDEQVTSLIAEIERKISKKPKVRLKVKLVQLWQSMLNVYRNKNDFLQKLFSPQFLILFFISGFALAVLLYQIVPGRIKITPWTDTNGSGSDITIPDTSQKSTTIKGFCNNFNNTYVSCENEAWNKKITSNNKQILKNIDHGYLIDSQVHVIAAVVPGDNSPSFVSQHILQGIADEQEKFNRESSSWKIFVLIAREKNNDFDKNQNEIANGGADIADELVKQPRILGVIAPYSSPSLVNIINKYCDNNLTLLSPTVSISREYLETKFKQYYNNKFSLNAKCFFRNTGTNKDASARLLSYLSEHQYEKVLVLKSNNDAFADSFWHDFQIQKSNYSQISFPSKIVLLSKNTKPTIDQWKKNYGSVSDKTAILMIKGPKGATDRIDEITDEVIKNNDGKFLILASNPVYQPNLIGELNLVASPTAISKIIIAVPWFPTKDEISQLKMSTSDLDSFYAMSFDATKLLIEAISKDAMGKKPTKEGVQYQLNRLGEMKGMTGDINLKNNDRYNSSYKLIQPNCQDNKNCEWLMF